MKRKLTALLLTLSLLAALGASAAFADNAAQRRFVPRAAERDNRHFILRFRSRPNDDLFRNQLDLVGIAERVALEEFVRDALRVVQKFLHNHRVCSL